LPFAICVAGQLRAQDLSDKFPDTARVTADFPDEAQRYAAFETLDTVLNADAPKPVSRAAYNKLFSYEASYNNIESMHMQQGTQSQFYKDWVARRDQAVNDFAFARSVVEKYNLTGLKAIPRPPPTPQPMATVNVPFSTSAPQPAPNLQHHAFLVLMPVAVVSWVLMYVLARLLLGRSGNKSLFSKPPQLVVNGDWPPLPEPLRVVHLPGVRYYLQTFSGLVLDKSTNITTSSYTSTTPEQVTVIGNTTHVTPGQTVTHRVSHQTDSLRVRTPDLRESTWTFTGKSGNQVFRGQIITALARPVKDDFSEFVLAYNHATGELIRIEQGLDNAHSTRGIFGWFAQPVATLVGTIGFSIVLGYFLTSPPPLITIAADMSGVILLLAGGFCSLTVAFFMVSWLRHGTCNRRSKKLIAKYGPAFRQYCEQITPALQKRLMR